MNASTLPMLIIADTNNVNVYTETNICIDKPGLEVQSLWISCPFSQCEPLGLKYS